MTEFDWETSINSRRSTRSFEAKALDKRSMALLKSFISDMEVPFEHTVELALFKAAPTKKLYMVFESPADNVAFISETDDVSISKTGFVGELFVLYATHLESRPVGTATIIQRKWRNCFPLRRADPAN